jgi:putative ABC transport system ATP-binding protein
MHSNQQEYRMEVTKVINATRDFKIGEVETHALRGVNLSVENSEFTALVGPSGSGKTTLLQLIGLLDQPTSGQVFINGKDATRLNRNQRADLRKGTIGFIFQFFALIPTLTAYENVEMPLLLNGTKPSQRKARVQEMLEAVGLTDRAHHRPDQLSGGQQQRVAVARALSIRPTVVLADEPTANLDTENGKQVMDIMAKLNQETGTTFVFATHDPRVIGYANRVVTLQDGLITKDSKTNGTSKVE